MNRDSANKLICAVRWGHGMLQLLDEFKHSPETTLGELQKLFFARFQVDPGEDWFYFNNQDQFMTQLWAYLCVPSETFHHDLPVTDLSLIDPRWGLSQVTVKGPNNLREVVKLLRNAVSHAHIDLIPNPLRFCFRDRNDTVTMGERDLQQFCRALNYWCLTSDANLERLDGH